MTETKIMQGIYAWISRTSGVACIWANQDGPRPPKPFVEMRLITGQVKLGGQDELRLESAAGDSFVAETSGPRAITCSINVFGGGSHDIITNIHDSLDDPSIIESLESGGLAVIDEGDPTNLTTLMETHWETRWQMDVRFGLTGSREVTPDVFEEVDTESLI